MKYFLAFFFVLVWSAAAQAKVVTETVEYRHGEAALEGLIAYDDGISGPRPGVAVVHEWWGINEHIRARTTRLAELGYVAFAIDMYGKSIRPGDSKEAAKLAGVYRGDRALMRSRARAGLDVLKKHRLTDSGRIVATGYCFGGTTVLELARSGADIAGVVSFHGNLDTPNPEDARKIKAKVLALHGANDPLVPEKQVLAFQDEMRKAGVDWQMSIYGGALHSFTNPESGNNPEKGVAYDKKADARSWRAMKDFLEEVFAKGR